MTNQTEPEKDPVEVVANHLINCTKTDAAIVVDGSGDEIIKTLLAAGWMWDGKVEYVAGKRIRSYRRLRL